MLYYISLFLFLVPHTFYVSICELNYSPEDESMQVSWRLFADDLEWAVTPVGDEYFYIGHPNYNSDSLLQVYFDAHFYLLVDDDVRLAPEYIGHEFQGEEIFCYFEVADYQPAAKTVLYTDVLCELYADQQHYLHLQNDGKLINTTLLTKSAPSAPLRLQ